MESSENYDSAIDHIFGVLNNPKAGQTTILEDEWDNPIDSKVYTDPENNLFVQVMVYLWSMESFIYDQVIKGSREQDFSLVDQLGPYQYALQQILTKVEDKKKDKTK